MEIVINVTTSVNKYWNSIVRSFKYKMNCILLVLLECVPAGAMWALFLTLRSNKMLFFFFTSFKTLMKSIFKIEGPQPFHRWIVITAKIYWHGGPPIRKIQEYNLFSAWKRPLGAIYFALVCKKFSFFVLIQIHFIGRHVIVNKQISWRYSRIRFARRRRMRITAPLPNVLF